MSKKRPAEFQLTSENYDDVEGEKGEINAQPAPLATETQGFGFSSYASTNPFALAAARPPATINEGASETVAENESATTSTFGSNTGFGGGFGAYAKINPFATAASSGTSFGSFASSSASSSFGSSSGLSAIAPTINTSGFGFSTAGPSSNGGGSGSSFASKAPPAVMIPLSPKSPKSNNNTPFWTHPRIHHPTHLVNNPLSLKALTRSLNRPRTFLPQTHVFTHPLTHPSSNPFTL